MPVEPFYKLTDKLDLAWTALGSFQVVFVLMIPVIAWLLRKPVAKLILKIANVIAHGLGLSLSDDFKNSIVPAARVLVVAAGGLIANEMLGLPEPYFGILDKLLLSICVIAVFSANYSLCVYIPQLFNSHTKKSHGPNQDGLVVRVAQFAVVFLGIAAVMKVWGIDIGPALTGMGVAGAAVALAAQDYLKNLMGGFNNAAERRFHVGEMIEVEGLVLGRVESVSLRSTVIRRLDTSPVHVPNSELANAAIINLDRRIYRRIYWNISLTYASSIDTLREICQRIEQYIDDSDHFVPADKASRFVRIDTFNDSSIDMLVYCFTRSKVYADYLDVKEDLTLAIKSIVKEAGGNFAFPSRSIYIEAVADAGPAQFVGTEEGNEQN
ncbi:MAG: mechanosensitive ion channel family protein [Arenicellales bacterium]